MIRQVHAFFSLRYQLLSFFFFVAMMAFVLVETRVMLRMPDKAGIIGASFGLMVPTFLLLNAINDYLQFGGVLSAQGAQMEVLRTSKRGDALYYRMQFADLIRVGMTYAAAVFIGCLMLSSMPQMMVALVYTIAFIGLGDRVTVLLCRRFGGLNEFMLILAGSSFVTLFFIGVVQGYVFSGEKNILPVDFSEMLWPFLIGIGILLVDGVIAFATVRLTIRNWRKRYEDVV